MAKSKKSSTLTLEEKLKAALVPEDEEPYEVPENWCWVKMGSIIFTSKEKTDDFNNLELKYVGLEHIEKNKGITGYDSVEGIKSLKNIFHKGQLLYGKLRPYLNKHDIADFDGVCSTDILVFDTTECISSSLVNLYFNQSCFIEYVVGHSKGINLPRVSENVILNASFPLPPLSEQHRIVSRIEGLFSQLDEARDKAQEVLESFEKRRAAILHAAFSGQLTEKWRIKNNYSFNDWKKMRIADIGDIVTGSTPSTKEQSYYGGSIPFIKPTELNQGKNIISSVETLTEAGKDVSRPVRKGSTCVCCIGATISKCGFLQVDAVTNQQINTIVPYDFMDDVFVYYYCSSNDFKDVLIENSSATTLPIINKGRMSGLPAVVPPKKEQEEISRLLDGILGEDDKVSEIILHVIDDIEIQKKSILAKAFRGELGTNNPEEESAIGLIKEILQDT